MADVPVPLIVTATPAAADTVLGVQGGAVKRFSAAALVAAGGAAVLDSTGKLPALQLPGEVAETKAGGVIAFVFDDGYRSNYINALPIFAKYGFAGTLAQEVERIGQNYNSDPNYPVCTAEDLRELIRAGWEVCNHPKLTITDTEGQMVSAAQSENQLLIDLLTGAKVKNYVTGVVSAGPSSYADEFGSYRVTSAVYRGGARNEASDRAYRFLYDKVRSINGSVAERGDHLYVFGPGAEQTMQMSAWPADTTSNSVEKTLAFIESIAQTRSKAILYAHDTPATAGDPGTPYIVASDLETILRRCRELGIAVVPLERFSRGNAISDSTFENLTGSLAAQSGDTVQFSTTDTLNGATRCVEISVPTTARANDSTRYSTADFVCEPFCRYRVRVRYKIDSELVLSGGASNRNHGLNVGLLTSQGNTSGVGAGEDHARVSVLNDQAAVARLPYQATVGYDEYQVELVTGLGARAAARVSLYNCTGTARIGQIIVEKLDSIIDRPLAGVRNFDTTLGRLISLPTPNTTNGRQWEWELSVVYNPSEPSGTYTYAYNDSASIASPANGQTCYVLGSGAGAFAGQGGKLATHNGISWAFSSIANGTLFRVTTSEGLAGRWFRHRGIKSDGSPLYETFFSAIANDRAIVKRESSSNFRVFESSGLRSDAFTWIARPRAVPV